MLQAYVQQLENSRLKLSQLEQDLQRARQQVFASSFHVLSGGQLEEVPQSSLILFFCATEGEVHLKHGRSIKWSGRQWYALLL